MHAKSQTILRNADGALLTNHLHHAGYALSPNNVRAHHSGGEPGKNWGAVTKGDCAGRSLIRRGEQMRVVGAQQRIVTALIGVLLAWTSLSRAAEQQPIVLRCTADSKEGYIVVDLGNKQATAQRISNDFMTLFAMSADDKRNNDSLLLAARFHIDETQIRVIGIRADHGNVWYRNSVVINRMSGTLSIINESCTGGHCDVDSEVMDPAHYARNEYRGTCQPSADKKLF